MINITKNFELNELSGLSFAEAADLKRQIDKLIDHIFDLSYELNEYREKNNS